MRKILWKTFLLCMACLVCVGGLCAAKDKDNMTLMWQDEHINDKLGEKYKYYLDDSATKIIDYEGRKYLQAYFQRNKVFMEQIWFVPMWRESEKAHWTRIYDVEQQKSFTLDYLNKDRKQKEGHYNISSMKQNLHDYSELDKKFMQWMETNRKSLLDEIRRANGGNPSASGAAGQPAGISATGGTMAWLESYTDLGNWFERKEKAVLMRGSDDPVSVGFTKTLGDGISEIDYSAPTEFKLLKCADQFLEGWKGDDNLFLGLDYDRESQIFTVWGPLSKGQGKTDWKKEYTVHFEGPDVAVVTILDDVFFHGDTPVIEAGQQYIARKGKQGVFWIELGDWKISGVGLDQDYIEPCLTDALKILIERNGNL